MIQAARDFKKGWRQTKWQTMFLLILFPSVLIAGLLGELLPMFADIFLGIAILGSFLWAASKSEAMFAGGVLIGLILAFFLLVVYNRWPRRQSHPISFRFAGHGFTVDSTLDGQKIMWT